jgi:hypothetical protein
MMARLDGRWTKLSSVDTTTKSTQDIFRNENFLVSFESTCANRPLHEQIELNLDCLISCTLVSVGC